MLTLIAVFYKFYFKKEIKLKKESIIIIEGKTIYYDSGFLYVYCPNRQLRCRKSHGSIDFVHRDFRLKYENNFFYLYLEFTRYKIELV